LEDADLLKNDAQDRRHDASPTMSQPQNLTACETTEQAQCMHHSPIKRGHTAHRVDLPITNAAFFSSFLIFNHPKLVAHSAVLHFLSSSSQKQPPPYHRPPPLPLSSVLSCACSVSLPTMTSIGKLSPAPWGQSVLVDLVPTVVPLCVGGVLSRG
jgi:hypothetical protein